MTKHINSCRKGKRIEREAVAFLKSLGFEDAERTQQHCGKAGDSDVRCPKSLPHLFIEVKGDESIETGNAKWQKAWTKALLDAGDTQIAVMLHRHKRKPWLLVVGANLLECPVTIIEADVIRVLVYTEGIAAKAVA
jgi:Holliday junction resolvase